MMCNIDLETLRKKLQEAAPVSFSYFKVGGELRNAVGTLHESLIPGDYKPKDSSINYANSFRYYDLEKEAWRSLNKDCSVVTIIE